MLLNILLSPIIFIMFFLVTTPFNNAVFTSGAGGNTSRLIFWTYLLFCACLLLALYSLTAIYNIAAPQKITVVELLQPRFYWLSLVCWLVTAFTLSVYRKGMEGNIMGFIFFPALIATSLALLAVNVGPLVKSFNAGGEPLLPNTWLAFFIHGFNPLLALLFLRSDALRDRTPGVEKDFLTTIASVYIFYLFILAFHWLLFLFSNKGLVLAEFWGVGQGLVYYLPFVGGALIYAHHFFVLRVKPVRGMLTNTLHIILCMTVTLSVGLQLINYAQYLKRAW